MNIILKKIHMENFKIFKDITIDFSKVTNIFGQNYKGKSSVADAFTWVLFGKSSTGNSEGKQFHPRRYDENGIDIDRVMIVVELFLNVDGRDILIRKIQKQNWVRKRGAEIETYEGDSNTYSWNEVEVKETEHKKRVAEIIDEELFKMITNPHAFLSQKQDVQRSFLVEKVAQITDDEIFSTNEKFEELRTLNENNTLEEIKAIHKKALDGYKEQQEQIPVRIDEVSKAIVEMNFSKKEQELSSLKEKLAKVEDQILDTSKGYEEVNELKTDIANIQGKIADIEREEQGKLAERKREVEKQIWELERQLRNANENHIKAENEITIKKKNIERNTEFLNTSRTQYAQIKAEVFDEATLNCPTCGQQYPEEKKAVLLENFINTQKKRLQGVVEQGNLLNENIEKDKAEIDTLKAKLTEYEANKKELEPQINDLKIKLADLPTEIDLSQNQVYEALENDLINSTGNLEIAINLTKDTDSRKQALLEQKKSVQNDIEDVQKDLAAKKTIEDSKNRVEVLKTQLKEVTVQAAKCERILLLLENFEKAKMNLLSERINGKFKVVQWKLFHTQKNGGVENVCIAMIHGSPYGENTTSTTERLMAGLDVINTLQEIYEVKAPIWIDNAESYNDFNIPKMGGQLITLNVSTDKELRVEGVD